MAGFSLGARDETAIGSFGFYIAGATEYTFEGTDMPSTAVQSQTAYSYTYYPDVEFNHNWITPTPEYAPISIEDNLEGERGGDLPGRLSRVQAHGLQQPRQSLA
jgi:hypothetical protein